MNWIKAADFNCYKECKSLNFSNVVDISIINKLFIKFKMKQNRKSVLWNYKSIDDLNKDFQKLETMLNNKNKKK